MLSRYYFVGRYQQTYLYVKLWDLQQDGLTRYVQWYNNGINTWETYSRCLNGLKA